MEYVVMLVMHFLKSAEFFLIEGVPMVSFDKLPVALEGLIFNLIKLTTIYLSVLG